MVTCGIILVFLVGMLVGVLAQSYWEPVKKEVRVPYEVPSHMRLVHESDWYNMQWRTNQLEKTVLDVAWGPTCHKSKLNRRLLEWTKEWLGVPDAEIQTINIHANVEETRVEVVRIASWREDAK